jgi:hypothetical protein
MSAHHGPLAAMQEDPLQGDIRKLQKACLDFAVVWETGASCSGS